MIGLTYKGKLKKNEKLNLNKKRRGFVIFNTRSALFMTKTLTPVKATHTCISIGHVSIGTHGLITSCSKG